MASASGNRMARCTNIGNCDLADQRAAIEIKPGTDFVCPECGKSLTTGGGTPPRARLPLPAILILALLFFGLLGFGAYKLLTHHPIVPRPDTPPLIRLGGSNTIGDKLVPALAEGWLKSQGCDSLTSTSPAKDETVLSCTANGKPLSVTIAAHGTETGFKGLHDGSYDIAMASDRIDADTASRLADVGDMTSPGAEHVIGFDGVAIIVNRGSMVSQLTLPQAAGLFSGEITDWAQVGGAAGPVHVNIRDKNSGTRKFFDRVVLKANGKTFAANAHEFEKGTELADAVASDPAGIGFVGAASAEVAKAVSVQATDGGQPYLPTSLSIRTEDYALSRRLFLYVPPKRTSPDVARFLSYVDSSAGQDIVQKLGFTSLTLTMEKHHEGPPASASAPPEYLRAINDANRLKLNFRFRSNSSDLDTLALSDIRHLAEFVAQQRIDPAQIMLIGFTDDRGATAYNVHLSVERAQSIADELQRTGIRVGNVIGFGKALPIASNDNDDGRNQNRRVEVWVKQ